MAEVVTNGAAFLQPYLQAHKPQAFGVPNADSPQIELQIAAEASRSNAAIAAAQVPATTEDRSNLSHDDAAPGRDQSATARRSLAAEPHHASDLPPGPIGPSKARVDISPVQLATPRSEPKPAPEANPGSTPVQPAAQPTSPTAAADSGGASDQAATSDVLAQATAATAQPAPVQDSGTALGPAEELNSLTLENIQQNIVGVAFAPLRVTQPEEDPAAAQRQKNFIFSQRKLFEAEQTTGKFAAEQTRHAVAAQQDETGAFAVQAGQPAATTAASGRFAASETAQKLADKAPTDQKAPIVEAGTGETRLYDKVAQGDTGNAFAQDGQSQGHQDQGRSDRESLYQRALAVAQQLGNKASNPEVKKLFQDLEQLRAETGGNAPTPVSPTVIVTA